MGVGEVAVSEPHDHRVKAMTASTVGRVVPQRGDIICLSRNSMNRAAALSALSAGLSRVQRDVDRPAPVCSPAPLLGRGGDG